MPLSRRRRQRPHHQELRGRTNSKTRRFRASSPGFERRGGSTPHSHSDSNLDLEAPVVRPTQETTAVAAQLGQ
ncbi:hypothetical protein J6590_020880 [Homalodisca vitripennis]|nr:hypothetical protein J6590_020880 [Homalodisca vitripennis]